ncbi:MAG: Fe-S cluster assembly ATPase SufC [Alphaproteobacteria bacterium]|nr:Fe-S cluster assembly ATPase SufC [Alphaproteobacteria bacterium]HCP01570.1 Fe-S cluster assembly ATPase SufC [Rhodospirillaceae bacterium]|tara:strand:+ start:242 stop:991 length:750 start_codon:yes stop_codon:yes gene_type:complete
MLEIHDLHATVDGKVILNGLNLTIDAGEVHAIMGPNGSGKSTLSYVLTGRHGYEVTGGKIMFDGNDLMQMEPDERAREGVFLAFQYPVEIPGVTSMTFLRTAVNAVREHRGEAPFDPMDFVKHLRKSATDLNISDDMLKRAVNVGFSGGEKKRMEMLQMAALEPRISILDETDSGLDIDALKIVADGVNAMRSSERGILLITHYQRLLEYIEPDHVHVLAQGQIVKSGDKSLALELEEKGYSEFLDNAA